MISWYRLELLFSLLSDCSLAKLLLTSSRPIFCPHHAARYDVAAVCCTVLLLVVQPSEICSSRILILSQIDVKLVLA